MSCGALSVALQSWGQWFACGLTSLVDLNIIVYVFSLFSFLLVVMMAYVLDQKLEIVLLGLFWASFVYGVRQGVHLCGRQGLSPTTWRREEVQECGIERYRTWLLEVAGADPTSDWKRTARLARGQRPDWCDDCRNASRARIGGRGL